MGTPTPVADLIAAVNAVVEHGQQTLAAKKLGIARTTLRDRLDEAERRGVTPQNPDGSQQTGMHPSVRLSLEDEITRLRRELKSALRASNAANVIRQEVMGLTERPLAPPRITWPKRAGRHLAETAIIQASDFHWGEVIDLAKMQGFNEYNIDIARRRLGRLFSTAADLLSNHWTGPPVHKIVVVLGGDMISGDIHQELITTNELQSMGALKDCAKHVAANLRKLLDQTECDIEVIGVPGNHGRTTIKPQAKLYTATNYDTLLYDLLEWHFMGEPRISFAVPESGHALLDIFGWKFFITHGDRMGTGGGQGQIGAIAPISRGMRRIVEKYAGLKIFVDCVLIGHYHVAVNPEFGYCNGSLNGPCEYGDGFQFRMHPATQNFLTVHPERFITQYRKIQVGHPDEGSIYAKPTR